MCRICAVRRDRRQKVLGVDETPACLAETLRRLLFTKSENVDALFTDTRCQAGKVAVGGHKAKAVEAPAVQGGPSRR